MSCVRCKSILHYHSCGLVCRNCGHMIDHEKELFCMGCNRPLDNIEKLDMWCKCCLEKI